MDVITALATPPGIGGIAVIRVSGDEAFEIVEKVFRGKKSIKKAKSHTILYGKIYDNEKLLDTVLVSVFKAPKTYTGENLIEISCHGGMLVADEIISALLKNGARLAEPGEFTKRAFLNGKMDLTQVEAVADIIHSQSIQGVQTAARQLVGSFKEKLSELRSKLIKIAGLLELELDFADEDIELIDRTVLLKEINDAQNYCKKLSDEFKTSELLRSGYFIGIAGYPNAGKSKLFNTLLNRNRAIVSEIPGTTRDYIEENLMINGVRVKLIDTAGLRQTTDTIEIQGIQMVESILKQSNMILVINDISVSQNHSDKLLNEIKQTYQEAKTILIQNKIDLMKNYTRRPNDIYISAKFGDGIDDLLKNIELEIKTNTEKDKDILVNQRQSTLLKQAIVDLEQAKNLIKEGVENEIVSIEIRNAGKRLGEITGESWSEEVLNTIFGNFCIGK